MHCLRRASSTMMVPAGRALYCGRFCCGAGPRPDAAARPAHGAGTQETARMARIDELKAPLVALYAAPFKHAAVWRRRRRSPSCVRTPTTKAGTGGFDGLFGSRTGFDRDTGKSLCGSSRERRRSRSIEPTTKRSTASRQDKRFEAFCMPRAPMPASSLLRRLSSASFTFSIDCALSVAMYCTMLLAIPICPVTQPRNRS